MKVRKGRGLSVNQDRKLLMLDDFPWSLVCDAIAEKIHYV